MVSTAVVGETFATARRFALPVAMRRPRHAPRIARLSAPLVASMLILSIVFIAAPAQVFAATTYKVASCTANLRSTPWSGSRILESVPSGTRLSVSDTVTGRHYSTVCAGKAVSGTTWYRVVEVNGKSIQSIAGVSHAYVAKGVVRSVSLTKYAMCSTDLRTSPSRTARVKATIPKYTKVVVAAKVNGSSWSKACAGETRTGTTWFRITAVNGKSVQSRYGVSSLYVRSGLFTSTGPPRTSKRVTSVAGLLTALADNSLDEIVVANGTYRVSPASSQASNSLWIGSRFAGRTRAVTVRAETRGGVTFDGGGGRTRRSHVR